MTCFINSTFIFSKKGGLEVFKTFLIVAYRVILWNRWASKTRARLIRSRKRENLSANLFRGQGRKSISLLFLAGARYIFSFRADTCSERSRKYIFLPFPCGNEIYFLLRRRRMFRRKYKIYLLATGSGGKIYFIFCFRRFQFDTKYISAERKIVAKSFRLPLRARPRRNLFRKRCATWLRSRHGKTALFQAT